jgi:carboxylesterase
MGSLRAPGPRLDPTLQKVKDMSNIIPGSEPFYIPGGATGCILMHGFTAMPEEMRGLGEFLSGQGHSVLGLRLAGHATHPSDLKRTHWTDWLLDVEGGLALLEDTCERSVLIGQSMGGVIALTAAASYKVQAVVAMSTPYGGPPEASLSDRLRLLLHPTIDKRVKRFPPDHPLHQRRELDYPAYPEFPSHILGELGKLVAAMPACLPQVRVPVLLIHSKDDKSVPFECMGKIYAQLGTAQKEMLALEGMDHSLVCDPKREVVFQAAERFLKKVEG